MLVQDILSRLHSYLEVDRYRDYAPNGLQVQGKQQIQKVVTGVSASRELIEKAIALQADAIFVHHGWFWKGENPCIVGIKHNRLKCLLTNDINLIAYHLPLDNHPDIGNNRLLGDLLGFTPIGRFGENDLGWLGTLPKTMKVAELAELVTCKLGRQPLVLGDDQQLVSTVGWCSGAAQDFLTDAANAGAQCYLSGEVSERTTHEARELGVPYLACGHHATERYGIEKLGQWLQKECLLDVTFLDLDNPV